MSLVLHAGVHFHVLMVDLVLSHSQVYDATDFTMLCAESAAEGEWWTGGAFLSMDRCAVFSSEGRAHLYILPPKYAMRWLSALKNWRTGAMEH